MGGMLFESKVYYECKVFSHRVAFELHIQAQMFARGIKEKIGPPSFHNTLSFLFLIIQIHVY
jgi:hypothetical protein